MEKEIKITIAIPDTPNFLRNLVKGRDKALLIPIEEFTDDELVKIGENWTKDLIKKAQKKRKHDKK